MKSKRTVVHTFISGEIKIRGELEFTGNIRLDNELEGNIIGHDGLLIIGEKCFVKGDISAEAVVVLGTVEGSIEAKDCIEVAASGKITGNVFAPKVNFEPGSIFIGRCTIGALNKTKAATISTLKQVTINAAGDGANEAAANEDVSGLMRETTENITEDEDW